ncbi:PREDICTED: uncharacterized protein LOC105555982 [Vollenhovia emeryi]|uniref:uncharacterized protein LOC105555982 n=1 Tax=Vollenhovia emeryi TaxID=411798 RepID=UPI0005F3E81C|nr:PREDICTED: uncharacterized protein LOC105555982 [Vollenhovia emeryi]
MDPSTRCRFLGFIYDTVTMSIELPEEKETKIGEQIRKISTVTQCSIRDFAKFIGSLGACCTALKFGWVHMKDFEREKFLALQRNNGNFEACMLLNTELERDFNWWKSHITTAKCAIRRFSPVLEIFSDASLSGWGVYCQGHRTHGHWNKEEKKCHINYLELLSAFFGLKCFAKNLKSSDLLLRIDNTTAIAYINKMGGIRFKKLSKLAKQIWEWCEERDLWIFASYIRSTENVEADFESRRLEPETEFTLSNTVFQTIVRKFGKPDIDLFASRINTKCSRYVSWKRDPGAMAIDAFTINWRQFYFYAFPPFSVILRVLEKIKAEGSRGIVVVPKWPAQAWYPKTTSTLGKDYPGCRNIVREAFKRREVPVEALNIMLSSLTESSVRQYDSSLKKWWRFCQKEFQEREVSYSTLNTCRSAIALLRGPEVGEDTRVKRFFKGIEKLRPNRPKYDSTWDPKVVLDKINHWGSNDVMTLERLSQKLVTLLALITGHRIQTLKLIDIRNIHKVEEISPTQFIPDSNLLEPPIVTAAL